MSLTRDYTELRQKNWRLLSLLTLSVLVLIFCLTRNDYGLTWDEVYRFQGGDNKLSYYKAFFLGEDRVDLQNDSYPGVFDLPLAIAHHAFPNLGTRSQKGHIYSFFFGMLGILSTWRLTAHLAGERAGFFAVILLATVPRYYGHMFFNPKDIPLAGTYTAGVWALVCLISYLPRPKLRYALWVGIASGFALSARIAGLLILFYFALLILAFLTIKHCRAIIGGNRVKSLSGVFSDIRFWALYGIAAGLVSLFILLIFWPAIHVNPFANAESALGKVQSFGWSGFVLMDGFFWKASDLPIYYILYWLVITLPELLQLLLLSSMVIGASTLLKYIESNKWPSYGVFLSRLTPVLAAFFPIGYILCSDPTLYDGMRHILFVVPSIVSVCALGLEFVIRRLDMIERKVWSAFFKVSVLFWSLLVIGEMIRLHPYQYVYFNHASGGLSAAYQQNETDYWGLSHKEAAEWLNDHVEKIDPEGRRIFRVHQRYSRWMLKEHLDSERFRMSKAREGADFFVAITRMNVHTSYPDAELLFTVERDGIPLCFIFKFDKNNRL